MEDEDSGSGGAGFSFDNFPLSFPADSEVCLSLLRRGSSEEALLAPTNPAGLGLAAEPWSIVTVVPKALDLTPSSLWSPLEEGGAAGCLRPSFGVRVGGLEPGLDSASLNTSSVVSSFFLSSRGGGVTVPLTAMSVLASFARFRGSAGFSLLCPPKVEESSWRPVDCKSRGRVTDFHSVSFAPWGTQEAEQDLRKRLLELELLSSSAATPRLLLMVLDFFRRWGDKNPEFPATTPLVTPAPLLGLWNLEGSAVSAEGAMKAPLPASLHSYSPPALRSECPSISLKELLRFGGVGAVFFFFLIRALKRLCFLSFGSSRSSSFKLLSRATLSFRGSKGEIAGS